MSSADSLPRLYALGAKAVLAMPQAEQEAIWNEYRKFWLEEKTLTKDHLQAEYQADWLEDREGTYR